MVLGELATIGLSYLGFVQWAIALEAGDDLKAMVPQVTTSDFRGQTYAGSRSPSIPRSRGRT